MKSLIILTCALLLTGGVLAAQSRDVDTQRRDDLERSLALLGNRIASLDAFLRAVIRSPIEEIEPVKLSLTEGQVRGSPDAKSVIVEFSDFQCPFCGQHSRTTFPELIRQYVDNGRVRYVFRNLPIPGLHPNAVKAAEAAQCAAEQNRFWQMHDQLFANQQSLASSDLLSYARISGLDIPKFEECFHQGRMVDRVKRDMAEAARLGLNGTPTFLFGEAEQNIVTATRRLSGTQPIQLFQAALGTPAK